MFEANEAYGIIMSMNRTLPIICEQTGQFSWNSALTKKRLLQIYMFISAVLTCRMGTVHVPFNV
jgi:hypothetical protein